MVTSVVVLVLLLVKVVEVFYKVRDNIRDEGWVGERGPLVTSRKVMISKVKVIKVDLSYHIIHIKKTRPKKVES